MTLSRAWVRQLFGASSAALLFPGAVVAALAVLALAGGFSGLGSFTQAFSGPALAASAQPQGVAPGSGGAAHLNAALAAIGSAPPPVVTAIPTTIAAPSHKTHKSGPSPVSSGTQPGSSGHTPAAGGKPPTGGGSPKPTSGGSPPSGGGSGGGSPSAVVNKVVGTLTTVTKALPPPVSTVVAPALNTVTTTLNTLLPPTTP